MHVATLAGHALVCPPHCPYAATAATQPPGRGGAGEGEGLGLGDGEGLGLGDGEGLGLGEGEGEGLAGLGEGEGCTAGGGGEGVAATPGLQAYHQALSRWQLYPLVQHVFCRRKAATRSRGGSSRFGFPANL